VILVRSDPKGAGVEVVEVEIVRALPLDIKGPCLVGTAGRYVVCVWVYAMSVLPQSPSALLTLNTLQYSRFRLNTCASAA